MIICACFSYIYNVIRRRERFGLLGVIVLYFGVLFNYNEPLSTAVSPSSGESIGIAELQDALAVVEHSASIIQIESYSDSPNKHSKKQDLKAHFSPDIKCNFPFEVHAAEYGLCQEFLLKFAKTDIAHPFSTFT
jgi:hypothetical protein